MHSHSIDPHIFPTVYNISSPQNRVARTTGSFFSSSFLVTLRFLKQLGWLRRGVNSYNALVIITRYSFVTFNYVIQKKKYTYAKGIEKCEKRYLFLHRDVIGEIDFTLTKIAWSVDDKKIFLHSIEY